MKRRILITLLAVMWLVPLHLMAQDPSRLERIRATLDSMAATDKNLAIPVDVSVTNFPVAELLRSLAIENGLSVNISVDRNKPTITCNLEQVPLKDVLFFFCEEKSLDVQDVSGILTFVPYVEPEPEKPLKIGFDADRGTVTYDFRACSLSDVARRFNEATGVNVIFPYSIADKEISGYGRDVLLEDVIPAIASVNDLRGRKESSGAWSIYAPGKQDGSGFFTGPSVPDSSMMSCVRVFRMNFRTVDDLPDIIPAWLKEGMEIKPFPDLNALILAGTFGKVRAVEDFLGQIDTRVPLVSIDVIIVDAVNSFSQDIGISLGKGSGKTSATTGTFSPGISLSLDASGINDVIRSINGLGIVNLGKVGDNFYAELKMLEDAGRVVLRSTPRLATLNGHKATLKSGEVKYYKESQVNIIGTQNPLQSESYLWKNVEASFVLDLLPMVSADSTITISIDLRQDEFTDRESGDLTAPPGMTKRSFNSIVKVKDQEMVMLGGIEKNLTKARGSGLPFIARVPVLRVLFGNVSKTKEDRKLNIFIRPTVLE
ncbi:MAG: type II and III secretion system protein [Bacteroidales bacterium]|nr:type II and III secretion system protein [Bacteroidales bacterium]